MDPAIVGVGALDRYNRYNRGGMLDRFALTLCNVSPDWHVIA